MKRCVVFGANGFVGSHVCEALLAAGHEVLAFDLARDFTTLASLDTPRLETRTGDFLDQSEVREAMVGAQWVFHLVSTTLPASSNKNMVFDVSSNVVASIELLEAALQSGVQKVLFASSGGTVYGVPAILPVPEEAPTDPIVSYGITKLAIEKYMHLYRRMYGLQCVALRIANPYGPRHHGLSQGVLSVILKKLHADEPITIWGDGSVVRDYIHIRDVASAFLSAALYEGPQEVFNIGTGVGVSLRELLAMAETITGRSSKVQYASPRGFDVPSIVLDISRARRELGWMPQKGLADGVRDTWMSLTGAQ